MKYTPLPDAIQAQLGKMPDATLARMAGVSLFTVNERRKALGIPSFRATTVDIPWTPEQDALLGQVADTALAKQWGVASLTVRRRRLRLGIEPFRRGHVARVWTQEMLAQLGTLTDRAFCQRYGISLVSIQLKRIERKQDCFHPPLPTLTPEQKHQLGLSSDRSLAQQWGMTIKMVMLIRRTHGIPPVILRSRRKLPQDPLDRRIARIIKDQRPLPLNAGAQTEVELEQAAVPTQAQVNGAESDDMADR